MLKTGLTSICFLAALDFSLYLLKQTEDQTLVGFTLDKLRGFDETNWSTIFVGVLAAFIATYWHGDASFGSKWRYCADRYNELSIMQSQVEGSKPQMQAGLNIAKADFSFDLLDTELWAHESFSRTFREVIQDAVWLFDEREGTNLQWSLDSNCLTIQDVKVALHAYAELHRMQLKNDLVAQQKETPPATDQQAVTA